ncbi:MAG: glycoside hydrolase family 3 C-terminal domain-containing protein [Bacteroidales bacterium]|jgi:beta-glucosidase|nr:glycoside hydrolase family 3 C-terminal domain-containing protein [Bacteroidales bacterium]
MKKGIFIFSLLMGTIAGAYSQKTPAYKDAKLPIAQRVDNLIALMTVEEKVEQLQSQLLFANDFDKRNYKVGHVRNKAHFIHTKGMESTVRCAEMINEDSREALKANRLGIPVLQHGEALHMALWGDATCFPQSISMAATFDDEFYYRVAEVIAKETKAVGVRQVYAPVVNISRDPRWGRTEEGYGEDVLLNSRMGVAFVKAMEKGGVVASPKHYVDNYGDGGHDSYASNVSWRVLREVFLEPFRACIEEGGARSIMASYNSVDGVPASSNHRLLTDILRNEWNFKGYVVSDYWGVSGVHSAHKVADSYAEAQALCLEAGLDIDLPGGYGDLLSLVKNGRISEETLDLSLRRILTVKFELGLFENPYVDPKKADQTVHSKEHRAFALEAARKVMTLLKNDENTLPLSDKNIKKAGVFGPAANVMSLGDYSGPFGRAKSEHISGSVTPYEGLKRRLQGKAEIVLHQGNTDVVELARTCDVAIFFAAIQEGEGEDRSILTLPKRNMKTAESLDNAMIVDTGEKLSFELDQEKMIEDLVASGVKTVVVLQNGSVIDIRRWADKVDAILEAWYPGEQGGIAIAEALFGDVNPGGRLPVTWARHAGQIPIYYYIKPSGRGYGYLDDDGKPMFPFGFGLSYTSFEYSDLVLPEKVNKNGDTKVVVTVKNTGAVKGDEVVQLYLHDEQASVVRPVKELKAFKRVTLNPGESRQVELSLPYRSFGLWDRDLKFIVEPGVFKVMIAKDAATTLLEGKITAEQ